MSVVLPRTRSEPDRLARLEGVDLLRGLAILLVLMNHVNMQLLFAHVPYTRGLPAQLVSTLVWNGQYGVQIFFAISGFLITATSLRRWGSLDRIRVGEFYFLRFARIAPLLLLLLGVLSVLHLLGAPHFVIRRSTGGLPGALEAALTFRINVLEARWGYLPGSWDILWSLSVEEAFYLFFPLACRFLPRRALVVLFGVLIVIGPVARTYLTHGSEVWREYSYLGATDAIGLGCLTALLLHHRACTRRQLLAFTVAGLVLVGSVLGTTEVLRHAGWMRAGLDMTAVALGACMLIVVSAQANARGLRWLAPLRLLGRHSYEVYLTHMFVVLGCFAIFVRVGKPMVGVPALFGAVILLAGLLGSLMARIYSDPLNRRLRLGFRPAAEDAIAKAGSCAI